ncbi:MAG: sulfite exporter TauE/SafE family protein [Pseudomonadota bacterium]
MTDTLLSLVSLPAFLLATAITLLAGFVKGAIGFAMPMIMISGLASFLPAELAIATLILPALLSNVWQALRQGIVAAAQAAWKFRLYLGLLVVMIVFGAQLVPILPQWALFLALGFPVTVFAALQLAGWRFRITPQSRPKFEAGVGLFAGFLGGLSGVWGPPTVLFLTALELPKLEHVRVQGVIYGIGALILGLAHLRSGLLNAETVQLSAAMVIPAFVGMALGMVVQDRLDQEKFRTITLIVLVIAGLNLVRRALVG